MKKILALTLALTLLLCGCGGANAAAPETTAEAPTVEQTQAPTTEPTTVPTTEPEVYRNPLNGEVLDAPFTDRIFANTVSNMQDNLPHVGVTQADILIETFVNKNNIIRCLALFSNIEDVEAIGSTRSTRPILPSTMIWCCPTPAVPARPWMMPRAGALTTSTSIPGKSLLRELPTGIRSITAPMRIPSSV